MIDFTVVFIKGEGTTRGKARIKCKPTDGGRAAMLSVIGIKQGLDACRLTEFGGVAPPTRNLHPCPWPVIAGIWRT